MAHASSTQLQLWIERMQAGDSTARDELIRRACDRLRGLTHKLLQGYRRVKRWEDTDDVLQNALLRLLRGLEAARPASVPEFFRLAATQIRRELIDLARHYYGPEGAGRKLVTKGPEDGSASVAQLPADRPTTTHDPQQLALWREFHEQVAALPEDERDVFDLVWYQGLTKIETATALNISQATVKRRWLSARLRLQAALKGVPVGW